MTDLDKIKMEVEAARFEVVQAEKEITGIKLALRSVAAKAPQAGGLPEGAEDSSNSLLISAIRVTGLPESATPSFRIQLSSPIEEKIITLLSDPLDPKKESSFADFKGVETSVATLVVRAYDADIPLGSSALYDVKPLCDIDVLKGGDKKVTTLDIAIVPDGAEGVGEVFLDAKSTVEDETGNGDDDGDDEAAVVDKAEEKEEQMDEVTKTENSQDEPEKEKEDEEKETTEIEGEDDANNAAVEESVPVSDAKTEIAAEEKSEDSPAAPTVEAEEETKEVTEESDSKEEGVEVEAEITTSASDSEQKDETDAPSVTAPLVPTCVIQMRIEFNPSIKDQKDELYDLLNKASKRKAMSVDKLRKSALAMNRASPAAETSIVNKEKAVKSGFLNKKAPVKKEMLLVRWYNKALGRESFVRKAFPIAKNYILFFGGVVLMHFQGQQLALPPPV